MQEIVNLVHQIICPCERVGSGHRSTVVNCALISLVYHFLFLCAEFRATSLNLVGNYSGPCILLLTGAAVSVKDPDGVNIATWPYNCIRQFRAEEETSVFSFISGRRGPYGVAEYIFELPEHILDDLQDALSQFTGAQFHIRPPSTSSGASQEGRKMSHSSELSTSSEFSVYNSPVHRLQKQSSRNSVGDVFGSISEEPHYKAPPHLTPDSSPSRSAKSDRNFPHSRDAWVLNSQSYETTQQALALKSKSPLKPKPAIETPPPPPPKKPGLGIGRLFSSQKQKPAHEGESPKRYMTIYGYPCTKGSVEKGITVFDIPKGQRPTKHFHCKASYYG